ncbi:hypothetical protein D3C73_1427530 [compost metagenome]
MFVQRLVLAVNRADAEQLHNLDAAHKIFEFFGHFTERLQALFGQGANIPRKFQADHGGQQQDDEGYAGKPPIDQHHGDNGADAKDNLKQQNEVNLRECKLNGRYVVVHPR